jgi:Tfp pilus assembly protein PilF
MRRRPTKLIIRAVAWVVAGIMLGPNVWAYWHFQAAERALARRDAAGAGRHAALCLKVWIWSADTHLLAARAARREGDCDRAECLLRECSRFGGDSGAISLEFSLIGVQRGEFSRVENFLFGLVSQGHPDSAHILEVLTRGYYATFQLAKARVCVEGWLEHEPTEIEGWRWRARVYEKLLNRPETMKSYRRVIELDPANDDARLALAGLLAADHQPQEALEHLEYLRPRLGDVTPILAGMAHCRRDLNQPDEARALLDQLLAREPDNAQILAERGRLALAYEPAAEAEKWLARAAGLMPFEKDINYSLYQCLERLGKRQQAQEVLARLKRIEADLDRIADLVRAIARTPHDAAPRCEAGQILIRNGQGAEGVRWLLSALREEPGHAAARAALADYYEHTGDREQAEKYRRSAEPGSALLLGASGKTAP